MDVGDVALSAAVGYLVAYLAVDIIHLTTSERITSEEHLETVVAEEAKKLGLSTRGLVARFVSKDDPDYASTFHHGAAFVRYAELDGEEFLIRGIQIKEGWAGNRNVVRHELYHHFKHFSKRLGFVGNFFYEEPCANLYALTGIKL